MTAQEKDTEDTRHLNGTRHESEAEFPGQKELSASEIEDIKNAS